MKIALEKNAKMPFRAHPFDGGADLCALEGGVIYPYGGVAEFDTGVHAAIPESCAGFVKGRSGMAFRNRVICHEGTIDYGYTGTIRVLLLNFGEEPYVVRPGDRIAQLVIQPVVLTPFEQVQKLDKTDRGNAGFGSTGVRYGKIQTPLRLHGRRNDHSEPEMVSDQSQRLQRRIRVYDAFVKWCKGKFDYGLILERIDTHKAWSPENCRWVKPQYCAASEQMKRQICVEWERMMQPLRKKYAKELARIESIKRQFFRYEHPDLVREGIVSER